MLLTIAKTLITVANMLFIAMLAYFLQKLDWDDPADRSSIVGFDAMVAVIVANTVIVWC